jgi:hypothetical protein
MVPSQHVWVPLQFPFGPASCEELPLDEIEELFLQTNRSIMNAVEFSSIIVGRRGSGKSTALSYATKQPKYWSTCAVDTLEVYFNLRSNIGVGQDLKVLRQRASVMWEKIIYDYVALEIVEKLSTPLDGAELSPAEVILLGELQTYTSSIEGGVTASGVYKRPSAFRIAFQLARTAVKFLTKDLDSSAPELSTALDDLHKLWFNFENIKSRIDQHLLEEDRHVLVCIDMLDELLLDDEAIQLIAAGQLNCLNKFKTSKSHIDVKCVMPEEMLADLQALAISVDKDFSSVSFIRWDKRNLIHLVTSRYFKFLQKRFPSASITKSVSELLSTSEYEEAFFSFFPREITNALGGKERTDDFLIRQTHCLPRQVINICNSIANTHFASAEALATLAPFSVDSVIAGVAENQSIICNSVFGAHAGGGRVSKGLIERLLRRLDRKFRYSEFEEKLKLISTEDNNRNAEETLDQLIDMGVVGVSLDGQDGSEKYNVAQFRYLSVWRPFFTNTSVFCLHPAFSGLYTSGRSPGDKATLPFGNALNFTD